MVKLAFAPLLLAITLRHNAVFAVIPLAIWPVYALARGEVGLRRWMRVGAISAVLVFSMVVIANGSTALLARHRTFPVQQLLLHDLAGISIRTRELLIPEKFLSAGRETALSAIEPKYFDNVSPLIYEGPVRISRNPKDIDLLRAAWVSAIRRHPRAYLAHRLSMFRGVMGLYTGTVKYPFYDGSYPPNTRVPSHLNAAAMGYIGAFREGMVYRGVSYVAILFAWLAVAASAWRQTWFVPVASVAASGLCYMAAYFLIGVSHDFRYASWTVVATLMIPLVRIMEVSGA
jgi:hypothetical protein